MAIAGHSNGAGEESEEETRAVAVERVASASIPIKAVLHLIILRSVRHEKQRVNFVKKPSIMNVRAEIAEQQDEDVWV